MKKTLLILVLILSANTVLLADIAPSSPKPVKARMQIYIDKEAKETKLIISRETLEALLRGGDGAAVASGASRSQTIFGGLLISASFVFGGFWLSRRKGLKPGVPVAGAIIVLALGGAAFVMGNAAPPIFQKIDSSLFSDAMKQNKAARGDILIEVDPRGYGDGVEMRIAPSPKEKKKTEN